jgi:phenol 2-monooxygenase
MDILANTDFPDVRQKCLISSANEGNVLILPREGGYVFRMYVELDKLRPDEKAASRKFTQDDMIAAANRIIRPYSIDVKEVVWWSIYDIGHSITDRFDDVPEGSDRNPRVFTAGDACHTHSPKAGQGMNVSMQDTFNLGWKLVHVLQGRADASLLRSYSKRAPDRGPAAGGDRPRVGAHHVGPHHPGRTRRHRGAAHHSPVQAEPGVHRRHCGEVRRLALFAAARTRRWPAGEEIGRRFHSAPVVRLSDAKQMQLGHVAEADARWRLYAFAGRGDKLGAGLGHPPAGRLAGDDPASPVVRHTRPGEDIDAVIDFRAVFQQTFDQLAYEQMPSLLRPKTGKLGLQDHEKVFCVDHKGVGDIFDMRGIDRERGCIVVVRPDQYTAHVLPLDG